MNFKELSLQEIDFMVKQTTFIEILPLISEDQLSFISGDFGPFQPNIPLTVPLWIALYLKSRNKCRLIPPPFMQVQNLEGYLLQEKSNKQSLINLPQNFYEIGFILLKEAEDDIDECERVKQLIDDIENQRDFKIQDHMDSIQENHMLIKFINIQPFEIDKRRNVFQEIMNNLHCNQQDASKI